MHDDKEHHIVSKILKPVKPFNSFFRNVFEWENPFLSFCALIVLPVFIWHFDIWMVPAFLILILLYQLFEQSNRSTDSEELEGDGNQENQVMKLVSSYVSYIVILYIG